MDFSGCISLADPYGDWRTMPIKDIWLRVYEKWSKRGADRSYAAWMADQAGKRHARKRQRGIAMDHCAVCGYFIEPDRCVKHRPDDTISPKGWCKYFRRGEPEEFGERSLSQTTKKESGYVDDARASMKGHDWRKRET